MYHEGMDEGLRVFLIWLNAIGMVTFLGLLVWFLVSMLRIKWKYDGKPKWLSRHRG